MEPLYNIYYAGEVLEGFDKSQVRAGLARLFKAGDATLDKLFSGSPQLLKRECDKPTALKYKQAMEKAGAKPLIKALNQTDSAPDSESASTPQTAAERIAALAAAADAGDYQVTTNPTTATPGDGGVDSGLGLEPEGTEVLKPQERAQPVIADIDTSALDVAPPAERLSETPAPPPPAPDTSHLTMGEVGESIPTLASGEVPIIPNTDALDLAPEGTDFSDCAAPEPVAPDLDLSALEVAPAGTDVLDEKQRKHTEPPPPETGHIQLQE